MQLAGDNSLRMADACDALADRWSPSAVLAAFSALSRTGGLEVVGK